jgi:hypothetical protein
MSLSPPSNLGVLPYADFKFRQSDRIKKNEVIAGQRNSEHSVGRRANPAPNTCPLYASCLRATYTVVSRLMKHTELSSMASWTSPAYP